MTIDPRLEGDLEGMSDDELGELRLYPIRRMTPSEVMAGIRDCLVELQRAVADGEIDPDSGATIAGHLGKTLDILRGAGVEDDEL